MLREWKLKILRKYYGKYFWTMCSWENDTEYKRYLGRLKRDFYTWIVYLVSGFEEDICEEALKQVSYNDVNQNN